MKYGYACINLSLGDKVTTNRNMIKKTFEAKGISYASELALKNSRDLITILKWNEQHDIPMFRITSDLFPWASEYTLGDMSNIDEIEQQLKRVRYIQDTYDLRVSFHPGPFNNLGSPNELVVKNTIKDLSHHGLLMNMMRQPMSRLAKINIHIGGTYGDKVETMKRWEENFHKLPSFVKTRLTLENDDKPNGYSVLDLYPFCRRIGIPLVFDYFHHSLNDAGLTEQEAFEMAYDTWPKGIMPTCHYSNSRRKYEDESVKVVAHADWIYKTPNTYGKEVGIMFETKMKDLAILDARAKGILV